MYRVLNHIDVVLNALFSPRLNPLFHTGVIALFSLLITSASGLYLFIFYRIGAEASFVSMDKLAQQPFYLGSIMRGLHRYSADLAIVAAIIHALRFLFLDRFRGHRWLSWVSGIWWVFVIWIIGMTGYWLVWDQRGQMIALSMVKTIGAIIVTGEPFARSFVHENLVKDNLFFVLLYLHIALSVLMAGMWWMHHNRIARPRIFPPLLLSVAIMVALVVISLIKPAISAPRADLYTIPSSVPLDLFYLFFVPLITLSGWIPLVCSGLLMAFFTSLPWIFKAPSKPAAEIISQECTGCLECYRDCPYEAISLRQTQPDSSDRPVKLEAVISPERCSSCGLCLGACEYGAIAGGRISLQEMEKRISEYSGQLRNQELSLLVFTCRLWPEIMNDVSPQGDLRGFHRVRIIAVPCIGAIPPGILFKALRLGIAGVFLASCIAEDCPYRQGHQWTLMRLKKQRIPYFQGDMSRISLKEYLPVEKKRFTKDLEAFRKQLSTRVEKTAQLQ